MGWSRCQAIALALLSDPMTARPNSHRYLGLQVWKKALRAANGDPEANQYASRFGPVAAAKRHYQKKICVHNTTGETVLVSVVGVDVITWALRKIYKAGASANEAELAVAVKEAADTQNSLTKYYVLEDGDSRHIVLLSLAKAVVTVASVVDQTRLFCESVVVGCRQKLKVEG